MHPGGFTHGPHPKALKNVFQQAKPATDEYAVMIDTRDALEISPAAAQIEWPRLRRQLEGREPMKLASLRRGGRDGRLVIVSRDLARCLPVPGIAPTLQAALDDWEALAPRLAARAAVLESQPDNADVMPFDPAQCAAPLPRAYHWVDGSAYVNHVELVRKARGAEMPASFWTDPLVYQGGSDDLLGARDDVPFGDTAWGIDLEAEVAVITDDVPMGTSAADAAAHIKLLVLVNDWSLRDLIPGELAKGFGFYQSKPATAFSPVAVTPDELGAAWRDSKVHLPLVSRINGQEFGRPDAGTDMTFSFAQLIAHVTKTRRLGRRRHRRLGHGLQLRSQPRRELPRRETHARAARARRAAHAVPAVRRPRVHRDARRRGPEHLRRARQSRGRPRSLGDRDFHQLRVQARAPGPRGR